MAKEVIEIQELLKRQKSYMRVILKMTEKLFEVQRQITEYAVKEGKKEPKEEKVQSDLLTSKDVCSMLEISASTLYRMRTYDGFPCGREKGRKSVLFRRQDIEEYYNNLKNKAND